MRYNPITTYAGIFSGGGAALWTLFEYAMGWHNKHLETGAMTGFIAIIFPLAAIIWAQRATKRSQSDQLSFKQALMCGFAVSAISAAIGVIFFYVYYTSINPGFINAMAARGQEVDIVTQLAAVVMGSFIFGLLIAAIAGMIMRTKGGGKMSDEFPGIFAELRDLMLKAAPAMVVTNDTPTNFSLKTPWIEARTGEPAWFGWIAIKKSYVAYHIMPLYSLPSLNATVPASLEKRRQGKTCFNFKKSDKALFEELRQLTDAAVKMDSELKTAIGK